MTASVNVWSGASSPEALASCQSRAVSMTRPGNGGNSSQLLSSANLHVLLGLVALAFVDNSLVSSLSESAFVFVC